MSARQGTSKVLLKLKKSVEAGDYYEAHQMYRTVCNRHVKGKQYDKAIELLSSGATILLEHKQYSSGLDLSNYLLDVYMQASKPVTKETLAMAIQWTTKNGYGPNGNVELHDYVGNLYRQEGNYAEAEKHYFLGSNQSASAWGDMLYEGSVGASDITRGVYIARPILQYLCENNLIGAQAALAAFQKRLEAEDATAFVVDTIAFGAPDVFGDDTDLPASSSESIPITIYRPPLVNFCQALIQLVQRDARDLFTMLRNRYRTELREEQALDKMLDVIGQRYFNIPLPSSGNNQMNMMQQMLQGILGGNMGGIRQS
ncbi:hypothetical protein BDF22DRAFT_695597 [Syncephalis plumigaleata]|nr:hypothetical protein BDF22DRAFT_695597 [Syncephalis plumigaleata]